MTRGKKWNNNNNNNNNNNTLSFFIFPFSIIDCIHKDGEKGVEKWRENLA
jgi:hypothetical protein